MSAPTTCELNLDGLPGPTHNFAGLASGNLAAMRHRFEVSSPRRAALQGLEKMRLLHGLGIAQAVMPPHERPHLPTLRRLGFSGSDQDILTKAQSDAPDLFRACCSSSAMWAANAATVSPGADTADGRVHLTPANLVSQLHRSIETPFTALLLKRIFADETRFAIHDPIPSSSTLRDEGAANHLRLCQGHASPGIEIFVWGESAFSSPSTSRPSTFSGRQTLEASQCVARQHGLSPDRTLFFQQNPAAIDAGAFHNDVVAVSNEHVLLFHESAFAVGREEALDQIRHRFPGLIALAISDTELPLSAAVDTYLFNSQIVTLPDGSFALIAPEECRHDPPARNCIEKILAEDNPLSAVHYVALDESMRNGGGPACLRLRVALDGDALAAVHAGIQFNAELDETLRRWIETHYREELRLDDLADPALLEESRRALDELTRILDLGSLYSFQQ